MSFSRLTCVNCGPDSLHKLGKCSRCGAVYQAPRVTEPTRFNPPINPQMHVMRRPRDQAAANRKRTGRPARECPETAELREHIAAGMSNEAIARRYGVARKTVAKWLASRGITPRKNGAPIKACPDPRELRALVEAGHALAQLCERFGVCVETMRRWLSENAIELPRGRKPNSKVPRETQSQEPASCSA